MPGRAAEEDLKSLIMNFAPATVCSESGIPEGKYSSGEYFMIPDDNACWADFKKLICQYVGTPGLEPLEPVRVRLQQLETGFSRQLEAWGDRPVPLPFRDALEESITPLAQMLIADTPSLLQLLDGT